MAQSAWRRITAPLAASIWSPGCVTAHLGAYLVASCGLLLVNVIRTPGELWFWRPLLLWGVLLALHAGATLLIRRSVRVPSVRRSLAPLVPVWARLRTVLALWSAPRLSIISRPALFMRNDAPAPPGPVQPPASAPAAAVESWPSWTPPAGEQTWPAPSPAWAASWPAPRTEQPPPTWASARPTGIDTVLNGAQTANPERPRWEELEVAATSWLASRSSDLDQSLAR